MSTTPYLPVMLGFLAAGLSSAGAQELPASPPPAPAVAAISSEPTAGTPKITYGEAVFDFGRIKSGDVVKHIFYFTNTGTATLELSNVHPGCGCTTAGEWTRRVEPGGTGEIPIQFNSANFNGAIMKSATVTSNDKTQPVTILQIKGTIWKPVDVTPTFAVLNIPPDAKSATSVVTITNNMEEAMDVFSPMSNNRAVTAELRTNTPGRGFQLAVTASQPLPPGNTQAQVTLKTTSTNMPVLTVQVWANVQAAVLVMPPQITLPSPPLQVKTLPTVMIQNYSTNSLQVTEPEVNLDGVEVTLQEVQLGRTYSVSLGFPQGYELPKGKSGILTVKTSHPQHATLKVPIHQLPPRNSQAAVAPAPPRPLQPAGH